jgi:hypothetical protein
MVVDDFDMRRSSFIPHKTDAPLVVDPDRMLSQPIGPQGFKTIAGRHPEIAQYPGLIQKTQLSESDVLNVRRQFSALAARPDQFGFGICEAPES